MYDKAAIKLTNDNLTADCSRLQEVWLEKERSYHLMCAKNEIAASKLGNLPALGKEYKKLYESKSVEQQDLAKELRAQQGGVKQSKEYRSNQKVMFVNLNQLLELLLK